MPRTATAFFLLILITLQMRGPVTSVGPVAALLRESLGLSASAYGLVAALPIAAFGLVSFIAPAAARRFGLVAALIGFTALLSLGGFLRSMPSYGWLLAGTVLVGSGIAALNVLVPVHIKERFSEKAARIMGIYTGVIGLSGAIGAQSAYPLAHATEFPQSPFLFWAVFALIAALLWQCCCGRSAGRSGAHPRVRGLYKQPAAVALTFVMGLQSLLIYTVAAWLPPYLAAHGASASLSGSAVAVYLLVGLPASILTARFMRLCGPEWVSEVLMSLCYLAGIYCWMQGGSWILLGSVLAGMPQGSMLSTAFILMAKKSESGAEMLGLSAMTQGFGYIGAGTGPLIFAALLNIDPDWQLSMGFIAVIVAAWMTAGFIASRFETVFPKKTA